MNLSDQESQEYFSNIAELLAQRHRAIEVLKNFHAGKFPANPRVKFQELEQLRLCSTPESLLSNPNLVSYLPLLGSLHRNNLSETKEALRVLEDLRKRQRTLQDFIPSYFALMSMLCVLVISLQAVFISPGIENALEVMNMKRMPTTLALNRFIRENVLAILISLTALYFLFSIAKRSNRIVEALANLPVIGNFFLGRGQVLSIASSQSLILAELLEQEVPKTLALITTVTPRNGCFQRWIKRPISSDARVPAYQSGIPDKLRIPASMVRVLKSEQISEDEVLYLRCLSKLYADRREYSDANLSNPSTLPVGVLALGLLVLLTALSVFLPTFQIITSLS